MKESLAIFAAAQVFVMGVVFAICFAVPASEYSGDWNQVRVGVVASAASAPVVLLFTALGRL